MKSYSLVKSEGLRNTARSQTELQNTDLSRPSEKARRQNLEHTRSQLGMKSDKKSDPAFLCSAALKKVEKDSFIRYTPTSNANSGIQRIVQISNVVEDPLEPPRHKHKKVAGGASEEAPPVIKRSPPRKLTAQDMKDWYVPACISNWKNANGYTIPLHMRLQADGRSLQHTTINSRHAQMADVLYAAERQARKEAEERNQIQHSIQVAQAMKREEKIKQAATLARAEKEGLMASSFSKLNSEIRHKGEGSDRAHSEDEDDLQGLPLAAGKKRSHKDKDHKQMGSEEDEKRQQEKKERDEIRRLLRKENERNRRREQAGLNKTKNERDADRDISEKIALGQAQPTTRDVMFDQRLFNQTSGLGHGFGDDEEYNLYDKPLFTDRTAASIYKNIRRETGQGALANQLSDDDGNEAQSDVKKVLRQAPQRGFEGSSDAQAAGAAQEQRKSARSKPVEFERRAMDEDQAFGQGGLEAPQKRSRKS